MSDNTIQSYRDALKLLLKFAAQALKKSATKLQVTDFNPELIVAYLADLEAARGNSIQTRNHRLVVIRRLHEFIAMHEPRLLDHCSRVLAIPRKRGAVLPEIQYMERDEVTAILNAAGSSSPLGHRDYALLLFMYNTGARVQEVADARTDWLALLPPYKTRILGKGRKWRVCPLWENTAQHLRRLIDERSPRHNEEDHLFLNRFGRPFSRAGIRNIIHRHVAKASKTMASLANRQVTPHTFRHTTAMHLLQSGVEVNVISSWLGHVSITTTNRYIEIDLAMKAKALESCDLSDAPSQKSWPPKPDILAWLDSL
jgi:site-specific recombinase XerD